MTPLRQRLTDDLRIRNYAPRTITTYVAAVARFAQHFHKPPDQLQAQHIRQYQLHLLHQQASWSRFNQTVAALRFLYHVTLQRPNVVTMIPYGKNPKALPGVLSSAEVARLFDAVPHRPRLWLFPGQRPGSHLSIGQAQRICHRAVRAAGITKKASIHTLRHSYATHLLESGTDLATLQKLLGHNQVSTTLRYTHIQEPHLQQVRSPLDTLPGLEPLPPRPPEVQPYWMSEPLSDSSPTATP